MSHTPHIVGYVQRPLHPSARSRGVFPVRALRRPGRFDLNTAPLWVQIAVIVAVAGVIGLGAGSSF